MQSSPSLELSGNDKIAAYGGGVMGDWFRRLIVLTVVTVWSVYMIVNGVFRQVPIPEAIWMIPTAAYVTFYPKFKFSRSRKDSSNADSE